jgi:hypothetical protein
VKGTCSGGSLAGDPEGYVERLWRGASLLIGALHWGTWGRARLLGTLRWMKGPRWMNCLPLSLKRLRGGGLGRSSFTGHPRRYFQKAAGFGHLSLQGPLCCTGNLAWQGEGSYACDFDG